MAFNSDEGPEVALRRLLNPSNNVTGFVILNVAGIPIKYNGVDATKALQISALVSELVVKTKQLLSLGSVNGAGGSGGGGGNEPSSPSKDAGDDDADALETMRLRTKDNELIITSEDEFTLVVIQNHAQSKAGSSDAKVDDEKHPHK